MSRSNRIGLHPELANAKWTLWAKHEKCGPMAWSDRAVNGWLPIITGMRHSVAIDELITRQDRVRRSEQPCVFQLLEDGKLPEKEAREKPPVRRRSK